MKKITLVLVFLSQFTIVFGQQYSSSNPQYKWGAWTPDNCFKGIYIRVQKAYFNKGANQWYWNWEIQNKYSRKVSISWTFYDNTKGRPEYTTQAHTFQAGEVRTNGAFGSETQLSYIIDKVCFAFKATNGTILDCSSEPEIYKKGYYYADCDNGQPKYSAYSGNTQANQTTQSKNNPTYSNTNTQTTPQNDPTFDRNNASFQDYYKRATAAGQAGNYDEAITLWNSAISVAVNDTQRNNAKAWLAEVQKAKNSTTTANNNYQQQQNAQIQARQQALLKQQQDLQRQQQLTQGVQQLATGVVDLVASIKADKERRRLEEQQRALAAKQKAIADEIANNKIAADAENGDYSAQKKAAAKAFEDSKYEVAENYYAKAIQNANSSKSEKVNMLDNYLTSLALAGKKKEYFYIINDLKTDNNFSRNTLFALSQVFSNDFQADTTLNYDNDIQDGINKLKKITWGKAPVVLNYLQATGLYTKYGVAADTKVGFEALEKLAEKKYPDKDALYYLGMLYLKGTSYLKPNDKKALSYFTDAINYGKQDITLVPSYASYSTDGYFNIRLLSFIKIAEIYSRKSGKSDKQDAKTMLYRFNKWYKPMIPNSDLSYFK